MLKKFLEIRALPLLPAKWAAKLVKNVSKSALRKVARVGTARAAMQMFFTTLRANVLTVINSVCVPVEAVVTVPQWRSGGFAGQRNKPMNRARPTLESLLEANAPLTSPLLEVEVAPVLPVAKWLSWPRVLS